MQPESAKENQSITLPTHLGRVGGVGAAGLAAEVDAAGLGADIKVEGPDGLVAVAEIAAAADVALVDLDVLGGPDGVAALVVPVAVGRRADGLALLAAVRDGRARAHRQEIFDEAELGRHGLLDRPRRARLQVVLDAALALARRRAVDVAVALPGVRRHVALDIEQVGPALVATSVPVHVLGVDVRARAVGVGAGRPGVVAVGRVVLLAALE